MKYVKTDYEGCPYIAAGKAYTVKKTFSGFDYVMVSGGNWPMVLHSTQDEMKWTECDAQGNEIGESNA